MKTIALLILLLLGKTCFAGCMVQITSIDGDKFLCKSWIFEQTKDATPNVNIVSTTELTRAQVSDIFAPLSEGITKSMTVIFREGYAISMRYETKDSYFVIKTKEDFSKEQLSNLNKLKMLIPTSKPKDT